MKNSASTKGSGKFIKKSIKNQFRSPLLKTRRKRVRENKKINLKKLFVVILIVILALFIPKAFSTGSQLLTSPKTSTIPCTWQICSIDTMKSSRDKARDNLNYPAYDNEIKSQVDLIKQSGANYISIDTPYDDEFLPYLRRWVRYSREAQLKIWFRGNWSSWEGWFDYPKNMTPEEHLQKTANFITSHPELFESDDIFDPCPECENSGFWPQPQKDADYQKFVELQQQETEAAFRKIKKWVSVRQSIIGGRARDVLKAPTFDSLGKNISIDHYIKNPEGMSSYLEYFAKNFNTKTLVSEFGAPIPDMNGPMTELEQAKFVEQIMEVLYKNRDNVTGINYWVLSLGTTSLIKENNSPKPVFNVLQKYFKPGLIEGTIKNSLGENLENITVKTSDEITHTKTDDKGYFSLTIPVRSVELLIDSNDYFSQKDSLEIKENNQIIEKYYNLEPKNPNLLYKLRLVWKKITG